MKVQAIRQAFSEGHITVEEVIAFCRSAGVDVAEATVRTQVSRLRKAAGLSGQRRTRVTSGASGLAEVSTRQAESVESALAFAGVVRTDALDVSTAEAIQRLLEALEHLLNSREFRAQLIVHDLAHFRTVGGQVPALPGWYVICDADDLPLYVGTANDLNGRLNTDSGSRDNFRNTKRQSDPQRNFLKAFHTCGHIASLHAVMVTEGALRSSLGMSVPLTARDRQSVEKVISIFRARLFRLQVRVVRLWP